jgi:hypothetical protein
MRSIVSVFTVAISLGAVLACPAPVKAQSSGSAQPNAAALQKISACSLLTKDEVKRHLPWIPVLDNLPIEEDDIGASGSGCNYPSVYIQVLSLSQSTMDRIRQQGGVETINGVGDEAYLRNNADEYAELFVRVGARMLTLQANMDGDFEALKPGVLGLANALLDKLP